MTTILDPSGERHPAEVPHAVRPAALDGRVIGLLDITKARRVPGYDPRFSWRELSS